MGAITISYRAQCGRRSGGDNPPFRELDLTPNAANGAMTAPSGGPGARGADVGGGCGAEGCGGRESYRWRRGRWAWGRHLGATVDRFRDRRVTTDGAKASMAGSISANVDDELLVQPRLDEEAPYRRRTLERRSGAHQCGVGRGRIVGPADRHGDSVPGQGLRGHRRVSPVRPTPPSLATMLARRRPPRLEVTV
jgi:hypothetical protein